MSARPVLGPAAPGALGTGLSWATPEPQGISDLLTVGAVDADGIVVRELVLDADYAAYSLGMAARPIGDGVFETAVLYVGTDPDSGDPQLHYVRAQGL